MVINNKSFLDLDEKEKLSLLREMTDLSFTDLRKVFLDTNNNLELDQILLKIVERDFGIFKLDYRDSIKLKALKKLLK